ncbi:hypothetical protein [Phenylobacterium immobile]|nr:hypothetical protein [Phenylobacterium immobile]
MLTVAIKPGHEKRWRAYVPVARAAIKAMREPTEAVLEVDEWTGGDLWRLSIDAALSQGDER